VVINLSESSRRFAVRDFPAAASREHGANLVLPRWRLRRWGTIGWLVLALPFLATVGWFAWSSGLWDIFTAPERFRAVIQSFGAWGPVVYVLAEVVQVIVPPIPGSIFPPVASTAFGPEAALALSMSGTTIGSAIVFALARRWGRPLLERLVDPKLIDKYAGVIAARGGLWLFVIMLLPFLPDDAVCAMVGSSAISFRRFLILTTLGRLPTTAFGVYLVSAPLANPTTFWLPIAVLVLLPPVIGFKYRSRLEAWLLRRSSMDA
jgi:uncharacterized membrane protein YdjX (TVP38/TMEM64 family)